MNTQCSLSALKKILKENRKYYSGVLFQGSFQLAPDYFRKTFRLNNFYLVAPGQYLGNKLIIGTNEIFNYNLIFIVRNNFLAAVNRIGKNIGCL